jgi:hypothetical protein
MLESESDTFWFNLKREVLIENGMKAIPQTENYEPLAHQSQLR